MKRIISVLASLSLILCLFAGCGSAPSAMNAGYDPRIITLLDGGRDPYAFVSSLASLIGEKTGCQIGLSSVKPVSAEACLEDGSIDFYIAISDDVSFGEDIIIMRSDMLFSIDTLVLSAEKPESEELAGLTAAAPLESSVFDASAGNEDYRSIGQILAVDSPSEALSMLTFGNADIAVLDEINARAITDAAPKEFYFYQRPLYSAEVYIYALKDMSGRKKVFSSVGWMLKKDRLANASFETLGADVTL